MIKNNLNLDSEIINLAHSVSKNWWLFLIRGIASILFGILSIIWPEISLITLVFLYGAYAFIDGIFALMAGAFGKALLAPRWWLIVVGILGIVAGVTAFMWAGMTALILLFFIGGWAIAIGIFQIFGAIQLRKEISNEWWLILNGLLSVIFGCVLFLMPGAGALALIWMIAFYAVLYGILMVGFAFNVRKYQDSMS